MREHLIELLVSLSGLISPAGATFFGAMVPLVEARYVIPLALEVWKLPLWQAFPIAVAGNLVPIPFVLWLLDPATKVLCRFKLGDRFVQWLFARTRARTSEKIEKYELLGLTIFVAIPLPVTGAWTGSVAAVIFGLKKVPSFIAIAVGTCIAASFASGVTVLIGGLVRWIISLFS